jgi:hypothetical protein
MGMFSTSGRHRAAQEPQTFARPAEASESQKLVDVKC